MISIQLQISLIVVFIALLFILLYQVRKRKLDLRFTLSWLFLDISLLLLSIFPSLLGILAGFIGIYSPVNMIFFLGFCFALLVIYTLTVAISKQSEEIKRLAQQVALMEKWISNEQDRKSDE